MYFDSESLLSIIDENLRNEDSINGLKLCIFYTIENTNIILQEKHMKKHEQRVVKTILEVTYFSWTRKVTLFFTVYNL